MFGFKSMIYSRFIKWWNKKFIFIRRLPWEYGFIRKEKNIIEKKDLAMHLCIGIHIGRQVHITWSANHTWKKDLCGGDGFFGKKKLAENLP